MTAATRKSRQYLRRRSQGLVPRQIWVMPAQWPEIRSYLASRGVEGVGAIALGVAIPGELVQK